MRGWLTTEAPTDYVCRRFLIPVELLAPFMGALDRLTHESNYEQFGTLTPAEMTALFTEILDTYTTTAGECETLAQIGVIEWRTAPPDPDTGDSVLADGASYLMTDYPEYWQMLVNTAHDAYWQFDATHFTVPDLLDRFALGSDVSPGEFGGSASHTLTASEMPAHTHSEGVTGVTGLFVAPGEVPAIVSGAAGVTGSTGGGGAHNNMPPYQKLYPYIRLRGNVSIPTPPTVNHAGEIVAYYGTELPEYSLACDGTSYLKATYPLLWAALETELNGAVKVFEVNATNFRVPELRGRTLIGYGAGSGLSARNDVVANIGAETHGLTTAEMPIHSHQIDQSTNTTTGGGGTRANAGASGGLQSTYPAGGASAHNNMQPSRVVRYAIRYA